MNIELLPGLTNVVRFPLEERVAPSMKLIAMIEPDVREVLSVGESFFIELPQHDLREQVSKRAFEAQRHLLEMRTEHGAWEGPFQQNADALLQQAAELLILAHRRCQEAHGVDRAVGMARRDETWAPDSTESATEWLITAGKADRARRVVCRPECGLKRMAALTNPPPPHSGAG